MVAHDCELIMFKQDNEVLNLWGIFKAIDCAGHKCILAKDFFLK